MKWTNFEVSRIRPADELSRSKPVRGRQMAFELFELTGKRALVTGSSQGIGFALAQGLAEHGAEIVLNGRDAAKLDAAATRLASAGHKVSVAGFDVTLRRPPRRGLKRSSEIPVRSISWSTMPACSSARRSRTFPSRNGSNCLPPIFRVRSMSVKPLPVT